jgi:hypothetical protein
VLAILFVATLICSALGFEEALVAVSLLALLMPFELAAPLAVLVSIPVAAVVVMQDWHKIHARSQCSLASPVRAVWHSVGTLGANCGT